MKKLGIVLIALHFAVLDFASASASPIPMKVVAECFPDETNNPYRLQKVIVKSMSVESHILEVYRSEIPAQSYRVEYGDDVGFVFYVTQDEQIQLEYETSQSTRTPGVLRINRRSGSGPRFDVTVTCFQ